MLARLLEVPSEVDPIGLEETRMRAATLLCKVTYLFRLSHSFLDIILFKLDGLLLKRQLIDTFPLCFYATFIFNVFFLY